MRRPASARATAFFSTPERVIGVTRAGSVPRGALAMLQAWPRTRIAANTTGRGSRSTAAGRTSVSGERGTPSSVTPIVKSTRPVTGSPGSPGPEATSNRR